MCWAISILLFAIVSVMGNPDPTCWSTGYTMDVCCGADDELSACWDDSYTRQRCCPTAALALPVAPLSPQLVLGTLATQQLSSLLDCWPSDAAAFSYEWCCSLRHGVRGSPKCWNEKEGLDFDRCCLPAVVGGLDRCVSNAGDWCTDQRIGWLENGVIDHRAYIGRGTGEEGWLEFGQEQFELLRDVAGVRPDTRVLDLGCGGLRLGRLLIPYLESGGYLGVDKSLRLIEAGWFVELDDAARARQPRFVVSDRFEFELFGGGRPPDVSYSFSLLTHLNSTDITLLLRRLGSLTRAIWPNHRFFATVRLIDDHRHKRNHSLALLELPDDLVEASESSSTARFYYTERELQRIAAAEGWWPEVPRLGAKFERLGSAFEARHRMVVFRQRPVHPPAE